MKKITIYQKGTSDVTILDDNDEDLDSYCQELSKIFKTSNVTILETSSSRLICRPTSLNSIVVEDIAINPPTSGLVEDTPSEKTEIQTEDIITDLD